MANYTEIEKEYNLLVQNKINAQIPQNGLPPLFVNNPNFASQIENIKQEATKEIRNKYLKLLAEYTGRNTIVYYSTFLHGRVSSNPELSINDNDMNGFMNCVCHCDKEKGLDLVLQTLGGVTTATESIVKYLRKCFNGDIRVIVPHLAMSAGTMIACAANEIVMGKESSLGPIDPQFMGVPAEGVLEEFENAFTDIKKDNQKILIWREIIGKYTPTLIGECKHAIDMSKDMVTSWLETGMFKDDDNRKDKAKKIVDSLASHKKTYMHDKHYDCNDCLDFGLKILKLEDDGQLQDLVLSVHHSYVLSSYVMPLSLKYIENNNGQFFILSGQK